MSDANAEDLIDDAKESYEEARERQEEALAQIARGDDLARYETVTLGELELEVKAWLPGDSIEAIQTAQQAAESGDIERVNESIGTILDVLADMTTKYDADFWSAYYDEYGPSGVILASKTILGPAIEDIEAKGDELGNWQEPGAVDR